MKKFVVLLSLMLLGAVIYISSVSAFADETDEDEISEETEETLEEEEEEVNYLYRIYYECLGGDFAPEIFVPVGYKEDDEKFYPPEPIKSGYLFDGWYTDTTYSKKITKLNKYTPLLAGDGKNAQGIDCIRLYAKWEPIKVPIPKFDHIENQVKGMMKVFFDTETAAGCDGYEIEYAPDINFSKSRIVDVDNLNDPVRIDNKMKRVYYLRTRAFVYDLTDEKVYSSYSVPTIFYLEYGLTEVEPSKDAGTIAAATIVGDRVVVTGEVPIRVIAYDDVYHVVKLDPMSNAIIGDLATMEKESEIDVSFPVHGNLMAKFALAVKTSESSYELISNPTFIDNPEALASIAIHPQPASKKGRQGQYDTSAGDKHFFHNFYLDSIIASSGSYDATYTYNGKTYYFYNPNRALNYDQNIVAANANGGTVTMQIMIRWNGASNDLITPTGRTPGYNYYAFNMEEPAAREKIEAAFMYLADYWGKSNRHVDNWILGNEVNTYLNTTGRWYWAGNISHDQFMNNYANTFRCLYYAAKCHNSLAQVFTCTDHTWNNRDRDWGTMGFITALDSYLKDMNPNIVWNLANHAYTAVLTNADPWNDGKVRIYSVAHSTGASFVSPYNLEVLTNYVSSHFPRTRIILSEVGFSSTGGTNPTLNGGRQSGPAVQAAATAYLYYKAHFTPNIDSCIFHTGDEHEAGKNFAIEFNESWNVYKYMDTPSYANYVNGYLGVIGANSWESIIPGFNANSLANMPSR